MSAKSGSEPLELRGPPRRVIAVVPIALPARGTVAVDLARHGAGKAERKRYVARAVPFGDGATELRLQLPRDLPPGRYDGVASIGGSERPVRLEVEPRLRLRVLPRESHITLTSERRAEIRILAANEGNAPVDIPRVSAFGVFEVGGLDTAIGQALRAELKTGERRVDRLMEEFVERHGGLVRVGVTEGAGDLAPGAATAIVATLELPTGLAPGHSYSGAWPLANASHRVVVTPAPAARASRRE